MTDRSTPGRAPPGAMSGLIKAAVILVGCLIVTSTAFVVLTHGRLSSTRVDRALQAMRQLAHGTERRLAGYDGPLPIRLLTAPARTPVLPVGDLPRSYSEFVEPRLALPRAAQTDPWGHSYLLVANQAGPRIRVSCISPGPNGIFESDSRQGAASEDDIMVQTEFSR